MDRKESVMALIAAAMDELQDIQEGLDADRYTFEDAANRLSDTVTDLNAAVDMAEEGISEI